MLAKLKEVVISLEKVLTWSHCVKLVFLWLLINFSANLWVSNPAVTFADFLSNTSLFGFGIICGIGIALEADRRKQVLSKRLKILSHIIFAPRETSNLVVTPPTSEASQSKRAD